MTNTLSTAEIKERSIKGAKWLLLTNGLGMPAAFLIALLLGRVGPVALGFYALAQILIGVIATFVIYGGPPVLSVFIPKIPNAGDRGRFLFSYLLILIAMMVVVLALFRLIPKGFEFLLQREFDMRNYAWFVLLSLVLVAQEILANTAAGLMLIKVTAIARQMTRTVLLPLIAVLFFFKRDILVAYSLQYIIGGFLAGYLAAAVVCVMGISREQRFTMGLGWYLPRGFWALSLSTQMATVFSFLYNNFDRLAVLSIQNVEGLGMYQAVISLSMMIGIVPQVLGTTLVPMFSSLLATQKWSALQKAYGLLQRTGSILMTGSALFLIAYSHELLSLFGQKYSSYAFLLSLFSVQYVVTSLHFGNTPILTAFEKNSIRLGVTTLQIFIQVAGTLLFIKSFGVMAIAWAKIVGVVFANAINIYYVTNRIGKGFAVPYSYKIGVGATLICMIVRNYLLPEGWAISTAVFLFFSACFCLGARITIKEMKGIAALALSRKVSSEAGMGY